MHPAYSVIVFTTASGGGFGLLVWLALLSVCGALPTDPLLGLAAFALAFGLVTGGLVASTAHLGRPERAWRAFSQWRTSWLSREGVLAVATYIPAGLFAAGWVVLGTTRGLFAVMAVLTVACAVATLFATGMIYASLPTIRQWHQPLTAPIYVVLGLASGAVLLNLLARSFGIAGAAIPWLAIGWLAAGAFLKWAYWRRIDGEARTHTIEGATGLGHLGKVRPLEPPHTQPNFIMREMGYQIARKHAERLRGLILLTGFLVPILASVLTQLPAAASAAAAVAAVSMSVGLLLERWLFFAEAEHVSMLYYGADAA